jgi:hypothetical protein
MPYNITKSNGTAHVVNDLVIDYTYTAALLGRDSTNFGQAVAQDALRHLENFSNITPPRGAIKGQLWFNSANNVLMQYIGNDPTGPNDNSSASVTHWQAVGSDFTNITSDLLPATDATKNIGSATKRFHKIYGVHGIFNSMSDPNTDGSIALQVTGDATLTSGTFYPTNTDALNLGKTDKVWNELWVNTAKVTNLLTLGANTNPVSLTSDAFSPNTILPDGTVNLGKNAQRFASVFATNLDTTSLFVGSGGLTSNLIPSTNLAYDLGSSAKKFNNVYANGFVENGVPLSTKYIQAGLAATTFTGDIILQATPPNSDSPQLVLRDNVNNTRVYYDIAGEAARIMGTYRGATSDKTLFFVEVNSGDANVASGDIIAGKLRLRTPSLTNETVAQIAGDGRVYFGNTTRSTVINGNASALNYDYGAGLKTIWHTGNMGSGSGLDADTVDGNHLSDLDNRYVNITGDTMSGFLTLINANPSDNLHAVPKQYLDALIAGIGNSKVNRSGDTMSGALNMGGYGIANMANPAGPYDSANKNYVDSKGWGVVDIAAPSGGNGYIRFGNGLIMQWGKDTNVRSGEQVVYTSYPYAFTSQTLSLNITLLFRVQDTNACIGSNTAMPSATGFYTQLYHTYDSGGSYNGFMWMAIGY